MRIRNCCNISGRSVFSRSGLVCLVFVLASFALMLAGCSSSEEMAKGNLTQIMRSGEQTIRPEGQSDSYIIRGGDQIQLSVWGYPEFNTTTALKSSGTLDLPLIGELIALGQTKGQLREQIRKRLSEYIQGEVNLTLTILSQSAQKVTVLGAVAKQDNYALTAEGTLLEILSAAGGTTPESDLRHIKILRGGVSRQPLEVDLSAYIENGDLESIPLVRPGDIVFVPKKGNVIRELSDFMRDAIFIFGFFRVFN